MTQSEALNILKLGHNTFLTGGAGTGKTFVINQFIKYLEEHNISHAITASTGIAATHIGGTTIHSFSGMGIKDSISDWDIDMMLQKEKLVKKINETEVLIIDEISMLHASRLDMVDKIFRNLRKKEVYNKSGEMLDNKTLPFGGIQIVFCGDFFQLPPVVKNKKNNNDAGLEKDWDDMSESEKKNFWNNRDKSQSDEYAFNARSWKEAKPVVCYLTENYRQEDNTLTNILNMMRSASEDLYDNLEALNDTKENNLTSPIRLYSHNIDVDKINSENYKNLESEKEVEFTMNMKGRKPLLENLKQNILAPEILKLKINTKVIFVKNSKDGKYQNGSLGIIKKFSEDNYPIVELTNGEKIIAYEEVWQAKNEDGDVLAEISQVPLRYAWAITIHKSQGMTLDEAEIDLTNGFGFGMGYVALSRVRSLSGLRLHGLNNQALQVANNVLIYDKTLKEKSKLAKSAISKYDEAELNDIHENVRVKMSGLKTPMSQGEIDEKKKKIKEEKIPTQSVTLKYILEGKNIDEISVLRDLRKETVIEHVCDIYKLPECVGDIKNKIENIINIELDNFYNENKNNKKYKDDFKTEEGRKEILKNIKIDLENNDKMKTVFDMYNKKYSGVTYTLLKLVRVLDLK